MLEEARAASRLRQRERQAKRAYSILGLKPPAKPTQGTERTQADAPAWRRTLGVLVGTILLVVIAFYGYSSVRAVLTWARTNWKLCLLVGIPLEIVFGVRNSLRLGRRRAE
jgi:hypothetical protein